MVIIMTAEICKIFISLFFVFGLYSAAYQIKLLTRRVRRRKSAIDKKDT